MIEPQESQNTINFVFRLPNGEKVSRRFYKNERIQVFIFLRKNRRHVRKNANKLKSFRPAAALPKLHQGNLMRAIIDLIKIK